MRRASVVALGLAIMLGVAAPALSQNFAPPPPAPPPPSMPSATTGPPATICSTDYGWCPIQYAASAAGGFCYCFYPPGTWIPGRGRYWPYDPSTASPYLNPHTGPPATLR